MQSRAVQLEIMCQGFKRKVDTQTIVIYGLERKIRELEAKLAKKKEVIHAICQAHREYNVKRDKWMMTVQDQYFKDILAMEEELYQGQQKDGYRPTYRANFTEVQDKKNDAMRTLSNTRKFAEGIAQQEDRENYKMEKRIESLKARCVFLEGEMNKFSRSATSLENQLNEMTQKLKDANEKLQSDESIAKEKHAEDLRLMREEWDEKRIALQEENRENVRRLSEEIDDLKSKISYLQDRTDNSSVETKNHIQEDARKILELQAEIKRLKDTSAKPTGNDKKLQEIKVVERPKSSTSPSTENKELIELRKTKREWLRQKTIMNDKIVELTQKIKSLESQNRNLTPNNRYSKVSDCRVSSERSADIKKESYISSATIQDSKRRRIALKKVNINDQVADDELPAHRKLNLALHQLLLKQNENDSTIGSSQSARFSKSSSSAAAVMSDNYSGLSSPFPPSSNLLNVTSMSNPSWRSGIKDNNKQPKSARKAARVPVPAPPQATYESWRQQQQQQDRSKEQLHIRNKTKASSNSGNVAEVTTAAVNANHVTSALEHQKKPLPYSQHPAKPPLLEVPTRTSPTRAREGETISPSCASQISEDGASKHRNASNSRSTSPISSMLSRSAQGNFMKLNVVTPTLLTGQIVTRRLCSSSGIHRPIPRVTAWASREEDKAEAAIPRGHKQQHQQQHLIESGGDQLRDLLGVKSNSPPRLQINSRMRGYANEGEDGSNYPKYVKNLENMLVSIQSANDKLLKSLNEENLQKAIRNKEAQQLELDLKERIRVLEIKNKKLEQKVRTSRRKSTLTRKRSSDSSFKSKAIRIPKPDHNDDDSKDEIEDGINSEPASPKRVVKATVVVPRFDLGKTTVKLAASRFALKSASRTSQMQSARAHHQSARAHHHSARVQSARRPSSAHAGRRVRSSNKTISSGSLKTRTRKVKSKKKSANSRKSSKTDKGDKNIVKTKPQSDSHFPKSAISESSLLKPRVASLGLLGRKVDVDSQFIVMEASELNK
eukprot:jgi/Bigna1/91134/estExt_fgenesh1_pg.C_890058